MKAHRKDNRYAADVAYFDRPIESFDFELCHEPAWCGIRKRRVFGGERPEVELGHPAIFPNILIAPQAKRLATHFRLPVDDEHTYILWVEFTPTPDGSEVAQSDAEIPVTYLPHPLRPDGDYDLTTFVNQDLMAWETQGTTFDRTTELLGASDRGITLYRKLLREQIERVARGEEPDGRVRDPALNETISFTLSTGQAAIARRMEAAKGA